MGDVTGRLREVVQAATEGPWVEAHAAISGRVLRLSPTAPTKVAECDPFLDDAEFIATFDPVMAAVMLDVIDAADAALVGPDATEQQAVELSDALVDALARFREVAG